MNSVVGIVVKSECACGFKEDWQRERGGDGGEDIESIIPHDDIRGEKLVERAPELRLCSGAEVSIYAQARRTHFSLTSVSKWARANRGRAWLEGEQGKANSGQTPLVKASRDAGALLTAALHQHPRASAAAGRSVCEAPLEHPCGKNQGTTTHFLRHSNKYFYVDVFIQLDLGFFMWKSKMTVDWNIYCFLVSTSKLWKQIHQKRFFF